MKSERIKIVTKIAGQGEETLIKDSCPFSKCSICTLISMGCKYGLTEIKVPNPGCPILIEVSQKITVVKSDEKE